MFFAINKNTGARMSSIDPNLSQEFYKNEEWYADSIFFTVKDDIDKSKIITKWRSGSDNIINTHGTIYDILPHFFIPNASEYNVEYIKDFETHNRCVGLIYSLVKNKKLKFQISKFTKPIEEKNILELDTSLLDFNSMTTETTLIDSNGRRRADITLPLKQYNELLGFGIVFEIQLTKQHDETTLIRSFDRANKGYSVVWLTPDDFTNKDLTTLKSDIVKIDPFITILSRYKEKCVDDIKEITLNYTSMLNKKRNELLSEFSDTFDDIQNQFKQLENIKINTQDNIKFIHRMIDEYMTLPEIEKRLLMAIEPINKDELFHNVAKQYYDECIKKVTNEEIKKQFDEYIESYLISVRVSLPEIVDKKVTFLSNDIINAITKQLSLDIFGLHTAQQKCPTCSSLLTFHSVGKFGPYVGCSNWKSGCKFSYSVKVKQ